MLKIDVETLREKIYERSLEQIISEAKVTKKAIYKILAGYKTDYRTARKLYLTYGAEILLNKERLAFLTIPKAPNYEMNQHGEVRNKKTGKIRKWYRGHLYLPAADGKVCVTRPSLLWQLFGVIKSKNMRRPVRLVRGNRSIYFDSYRAAARFLQPKVYLSFGGVMIYFWKRKPKIYDWGIEYL